MALSKNWNDKSGFLACVYPMIRIKKQITNILKYTFWDHDYSIGVHARSFLTIKLKRVHSKRVNRNGDRKTKID